MSWEVSKLCSERVFGSPVKKQIIMYLADKASDDGSGIWCSKGTVAKITELGDSTVKRSMAALVADGILVETGHYPCEYGYTVVYRIDLRAVDDLEKVFRDKDARKGPPAIAGGVHNEMRSPSTKRPVPRSQRDPNHPTTIPKPSTRESTLVAVDDEFEKVWVEFPQDRLRGKAVCFHFYQAALASGVLPEELRMAIMSYARASEGFTRSKVCYSDNWFKQERWAPHVKELRQAASIAADNAELQLARLAKWVEDGSALCRHISQAQAKLLLERGLTTRAALREAGVAA